MHTLVGDWSGTSRLWFEPGEPANTSPAVLSVRPTLGGRGVILEYRWTMQAAEDDGEVTEAEEQLGTLVVTPVDDGHHLASIDTFGTGGTIMLLTSTALAEGALADPPPADVGADVTPLVQVLGSYHGDGEIWGWRMAITQIDHDNLVITSWNVEPTSEQQLAVVDSYTRQIDPHDEVAI